LEARANSLLSTFDETSTKSLTDFQSKYDGVKNTTEAATTTLREAITKQSEETATSTDTLVRETNEQLTTYQTNHDKELNAARDAVKKTSNETIEKLATDFRAALKDQDAKYDEHRKNAQKEYGALVVELSTLEGQIKDSIQRATGFSLFHSFQKRQEELVASKNFWSRTLATVVFISLCLSVAFIFYLHFNPTDYGPAFYLKLSISLPIIYAIWYSNCTFGYIVGAALHPQKSKALLNPNKTSRPVFRLT